MSSRWTMVGIAVGGLFFTSGWEAVGKGCPNGGKPGASPPPNFGPVQRPPQVPPLIGLPPSASVPGPTITPMFGPLFPGQPINICRPPPCQQMPAASSTMTALPLSTPSPAPPAIVPPAIVPPSVRPPAVNGPTFPYRILIQPTLPSTYFVPAQRMLVSLGLQREQTHTQLALLHMTQQALRRNQQMQLLALALQRAQQRQLQAALRPPTPPLQAGVFNPPLSFSYGEPQAALRESPTLSPPAEPAPRPAVRSDPESMARGILGLAREFERAGERENAKLFCRKVLNQYPFTDSADDAQAMLDRLEKLEKVGR